MSIDLNCPLCVECAGEEIVALQAQLAEAQRECANVREQRDRYRDDYDATLLRLASTDRQLAEARTEIEHLIAASQETDRVSD